MNRRMWFIAAILLMASAAAREAIAVPRPNPRKVDAISMQNFSWGKPTSEWRIEADGNARFSYSDGAGSTDFYEYNVLSKATRLTPEQFVALEDILRPAEQWAGRELPCKHFITDGPYGTLTWHRTDGPQTLAFDYGCLTKKAIRVLTRLERAHSTVHAWMVQAPVVEVKQVRKPSP